MLEDHQAFRLHSQLAMTQHHTMTSANHKARKCCSCVLLNKDTTMLPCLKTKIIKNYCIPKQTWMTPKLINQTCCFNMHRFRGVGIVAIIMMIFDGNEFDSENITFLLHVPSAVPKFALLQTAVITAGLYFKKISGKGFSSKSLQIF